MSDWESKQSEDDTGGRARRLFSPWLKDAEVLLLDDYGPAVVRSRAMGTFSYWLRVETQGNNWMFELATQDEANEVIGAPGKPGRNLPVPRNSGSNPRTPRRPRRKA